MGVGDDGGALGHPITDRVMELDVVEEFFRLGIEGGAAHNHLLEASAETLFHFLADFVTDDVVDHRDSQQEFDLFDDFFDFGLIDFFNDQRNGDDEVGTDLREGAEDDFRAGRFPQKDDVRPVADFEEEFEHHTVHMRHRKHRYDRVIFVEPRFRHIVGEVQVGPDGPVGNHYAFGKAGGARSIVDQGQFFRAVFIEADIFFFQSVGVTLLEQFFTAYEGGFDLLAPGREKFDALDTGVRVLKQVTDIVRCEIIEDGNGHGPVGHRRQETDGPTRGVLSAQGNLVSRNNAGQLIEEMVTGNVVAHILETEGFTQQIGDGGTRPMADELFLIQFIY